MADTLAPPVRYTPDVEQPEDGEADTSHALNEQFRTILETTSKDYDHAVRAVHAKSHGLLDATLTVRDGLPAELAQGLFAKPGSYPAVLRFSTNAGDILDDAIALPRGLALKVIGVEGARLPGSEGDATQDFVMVNGPAFAAPTAKAFLANLKLLAKTTDRVEWAKKALSAVLSTAESALEAVGGQSAMLKNMGGAPQVHPLGQTYYAQTPFRYGDLISKFAIVPVSPNLKALEQDVINAHGRPDAIREAMSEAMIEADAVWELRVQFCRDLETMPIEDASTPWDEAASPFVTVATLTAPVQASWTHERAREMDDGLRFSIWTGLAAHQPLGSVNRVRRSAYELSADFRGRFNGCPIHEPTGRATSAVT